jgi:hypothetical protein
MRSTDVVRLGNLFGLNNCGEAYKMVIKNLYELYQNGYYTLPQVEEQLNLIEKEFDKVDGWETIPLSEAAKIWK